MIRQNLVSLKSRFRITSCNMGGFRYNLLRVVMGYLSPNSKMEILTLFSNLNSLFLHKMEILTLLSSLNYFSYPKLEIPTFFSILNSLFLLKMEISPIFSSLNKKIWETTSRLDKIYFQVTHSSQIFLYI